MVIKSKLGGRLVGDRLVYHCVSESNRAEGRISILCVGNCVDSGFNICRVLQRFIVGREQDIKLPYINLGSPPTQIFL